MANRLADYHNKTKPILELFSRKELIVSVDGSKPAVDVQANCGETGVEHAGSGLIQSNRLLNEGACTQAGYPKKVRLARAASAGLFAGRRNTLASTLNREQSLAMWDLLGSFRLPLSSSDAAPLLPSKLPRLGDAHVGLRHKDTQRFRGRNAIGVDRAVIAVVTLDNRLWASRPCSLRRA